MWACRGTRGTELQLLTSPGNASNRFGAVGSASFEKAKYNFMRSTAGYAVSSYIMNNKDRHNGNLLLDSEGRMVHIDFGFILDISPGGNLGFETASFKLSKEMVPLIDPSGKLTSKTYTEFEDLVVKGFLAAREHMEEIMQLFELQAESGLPCFERGKPIANVRERFMPELTDEEAAMRIRKQVRDAYGKWTTGCYDIIQYAQQGIRY